MGFLQTEQGWLHNAYVHTSGLAERVTHDGAQRATYHNSTSVCYVKRIAASRNSRQSDRFADDIVKLASY